MLSKGIIGDLTTPVSRSPPASGIAVFVLELMRDNWTSVSQLGQFGNFWKYFWMSQLGEGATGIW